MGPEELTLLVKERTTFLIGFDLVGVADALATTAVVKFLSPTK